VEGRRGKKKAGRVEEAAKIQRKERLISPKNKERSGGTREELRNKEGEKKISDRGKWGVGAKKKGIPDLALQEVTHTPSEGKGGEMEQRIRRKGSVLTEGQGYKGDDKTICCGKCRHQRAIKGSAPWEEG